MGGVTIAHQPVSTTEVVEDNYYPTTDSDTAVENEQYNQLLVAAAAAAAVASNEQWSENLSSVEDLTSEVQELMMRESINSWLQPWMAENAACLAELDNQIYAQSIQLEDLFSQDDMNLSSGMVQQSLYDEMTFAPEDMSLTMSAPTSSASSPNTSAQVSPVVYPLTTDDIQVNIEHDETIERLDEPINVLKRRRSSTSSDDSTDDDSSSAEEDDDQDDSDSENEDVVIPTTVANLNSRRRMSYSSESDSEDEPTIHRRSRACSPIANPYMYMHKRQIEETLLDRITNSLHPDKLPGILSILASEKPDQQEDEVEIDLSCLAREQLVQILFYVDACIVEQNGGPAVNIDDFVMEKKSSKKNSRPAQEERSRQTKSRRARRPRKPRTKSRAELTEDLDADSSLSEEDCDPLSVDNVVSLGGPISMASLTKKHKSSRPPTSTTKSGRRKASKGGNKHRNRRKSEDDEDVSSSVTVIQDPSSIASSRPKRRAAIHKRRLLEQMLAPSDGESEEDAEDGVLVVYSDEKMDFNVVDNCTIVHSSEPIPVPVKKEDMMAISNNADEEEDEEIDILF
ncbi:hypothetical protein RMATCC62417_00620 [Rhizopus microsporus]|nr:hypothetical protein RMATCC62417_00620 [Rhizopus microsporus]